MTRKKNKYKKEYYSDESSSEPEMDEINLHLYESGVNDKVYNIYSEVSKSILFPYKWHYGEFCSFINNMRESNLNISPYNRHELSNWKESIGENGLYYNVNMICKLIMSIHKRDRYVYSHINNLNNETLKKEVVMFLFKMSIMI